MKVERLSFREGLGLEQLPSIAIDADLFMLFISRQFKCKQKFINRIRERYATVIQKILDPLDILTSFIGLRTILKQLIEDEVGCPNILRKRTCASGFNYYDQKRLFSADSKRESHNQGMTKTMLSEC